VNTALLSDLEQRQEEGTVVECIGDVFLKHADNMTCYIEYCGNQMNASKFLIMRRSADRELDQFLKVSFFRMLERVFNYLTNETCAFGFHLSETATGAAVQKP